jgi:hypothetical protein
MVVAVRSLSRSEQVKTLLAGPSPISPMKAKITISNRAEGLDRRWPREVKEEAGRKLYLALASLK